jgi:hypothetical protein
MEVEAQILDGGGMANVREQGAKEEPEGLRESVAIEERRIDQEQGVAI